MSEGKMLNRQMLNSFDTVFLIDVKKKMSVQSCENICFNLRSPQYINLSEVGRKIFYVYLTTEVFNCT